MSKVKSSAKTTPKKSNIIDNIVIKVDEYEKIDDDLWILVNNNL